MSTISIVPGRLADELPPAGSQRWAAGGDRETHGVGALDCLVVQVQGDLDIIGLREFRQALSYALSGPERTLVVDLRRTRFLSLRNATVLAEAMDEARSANIETCLLTGRRQIERALEVTGVRDRARRTVPGSRRSHPESPALQ